MKRHKNNRQVLGKYEGISIKDVNMFNNVKERAKIHRIAKENKNQE